MDRRINNVVRGLIEVGVRQGAHVGVLMETRPSALVAIAALSRLGAVAVLMPPDADLADRRPAGRGVGDHRRSEPPRGRARRSTCGCWCSAAANRATCNLPEQTPTSSTWRRSTPTWSICPAGIGPTPGWPATWRSSAFSSIGGELVARQITNYRWALSAFGTASAANLGRGDTVYCLTPLHHQSGLLVALGGAVVGGSRIALSRGLRPDRFVQEIRQYGVTVVSYTWAMLRDVIDDPSFSLTGSHPVRLFIGSGMPTGLWKRVVDVFAPAHVVEFFATTDGQAVLANVSGAKVGSKGRALPGGGEVALAAYDPEDDLILEDERGFVRKADTNEVGVLLAHPRGPVDPTASVKRGVFAPADTWVSTEYLFRRDEDGDYWLVDNRGTVIHTARGVGLRLAGQRRRRAARGGGSGGDLRGGGRRPSTRRHRAGAAPRRQHPDGGSVRSAGRSAGRQPARHRARGARDGPQRVLPTAASARCAPRESPSRRVTPGIWIPIRIGTSG